ncbi:MAG: hypothetical protein H6718_15520 [Polyangiaceae bacterium]|nr:hypothetical protein [Polyangiaceae bacterium]MCB9606315.1 hypothetical protein [Polyangiaceae bacterium]
MASRLGASRWLWVWGLGITLYGCSKPSEGQKPPKPNKAEVEACKTQCEELASAEKATCEKPVLEPEQCRRALGFAEDDCKLRCAPDSQ